MTSTDPYAHGTPVGDYHSWVRPESLPCPNCVCCSKALCDQAIANDAADELALACHLIAHGPSDFDLSLCPCTRNLPGHTPLAKDEQAAYDAQVERVRRSAEANR